MIIAYLYYDFLNLYGESGNVKIISNVLKENKIKHKILYLSLDDELDFNSYDLVYIASGTEENQKIALDKLLKYKKDIKKYIEDNKFLLVTGNSVDLFSKKIIADKEYKALDIFDYEVKQEKRKMEEVYINTDLTKNKIIGFINNNSYVSNNLFDKGIYNYKNTYLTYILGPILVRNPEFLKYFMNKLVSKKLKYNLKIETKAYNEFINNYDKEKVYE